MKTMQMRDLLKEAAGVVVIALVLAGAAVILRPALRPMVMRDATRDIQNGSGDGDPVAHITLAQAHSRFKQNSALFADARPLAAYGHGHIKGAMHLDPNDFDNWSETFFSQFSPEMTIITYCDGPLCPLSSELAEKLTWMGYENVFVLKNGWQLWQEAQFPVESVAQ